MKKIELKNFNYFYDNFHAVKNVNFCFKIGNIYRVVGKNGCGKSTLLKAIANMEKDLKVVYLDQNFYANLADELTVDQHLKIFGDTNIKRVCLKFGVVLSIYNAGAEYVGNLSGGQKQVLALLLSLFQNADFYCLDEFVSAMDSESTKKALQIVENFRTKNPIGIIYVSHFEALFANELLLSLD